MTDNELAKIHVPVHGRRGTAAVTSRRKLYRFFFPERPGALLGFLNEMGQRWKHQLVPLPQPWIGPMGVFLMGFSGVGMQRA